jgi:hypothetical protein
LDSLSSSRGRLLFPCSHLQRYDALRDWSTAEALKAATRKTSVPLSCLVGRRCDDVGRDTHQDMTFLYQRSASVGPGSSIHVAQPLKHDSLLCAGSDKRYLIRVCSLATNMARAKHCMSFRMWRSSFVTVFCGQFSDKIRYLAMVVTCFRQQGMCDRIKSSHAHGAVYQCHLLLGECVV